MKVEREKRRDENIVGGHDIRVNKSLMSILTASIYLLYHLMFYQKLVSHVYPIFVHYFVSVVYEKIFRNSVDEENTELNNQFIQNCLC